MASIDSVEGPVDRSEILLLSLSFLSHFDEDYSSLINNLSKSTQLKRATSAIGAIQYLQANNPQSILVTDEGLTMQENRAVLNKVVSYVHNGGLVIIGLHFPNFVNWHDPDKFFNNNFGLPWQLGDYTRWDFRSIPPALFLQV